MLRYCGISSLVLEPVCFQWQFVPCSERSYLVKEDFLFALQYVTLQGVASAVDAAGKSHSRMQVWVGLEPVALLRSTLPVPTQHETQNKFYLKSL